LGYEPNELPLLHSAPLFCLLGYYTQCTGRCQGEENLWQGDCI